MTTALLAMWLLLAAPMTQAQAQAKAVSIWGPGGWAKQVKSKYEVGCTLNGVPRLEGSGSSYANAFSKINPANGVHTVTVTQNGVTSNGQSFTVCY